MAYEELKALKAEDFMAPNPVLCYGGGGAFEGVAPYLIDCGIHVVGVMDANKAGSVTVAGKEFPLLTVQRAMELYGTDVIVMITIADDQVFRQVKQELIGHGYAGGKIFDLNVWSWLTVPSEKSFCKFFPEYLNLFCSGMAKCCLGGVKDPFLCENFVGGRPVRESIDCFWEKHLYYLEESKQGRIPLYCRDCPLLTEKPAEGSGAIKFFGFSDNTYCNADCAYCGAGCSCPRPQDVTTPEERMDAFLAMLEKLQRVGLLDRRCAVVLSGGEITVNPHRKTIYAALNRVLHRSPEMQLRIYSNCFLYDPELADLLALGTGSFLQCDLDAGTPESYIKVKGFNKFAAVQENLKKYAQFGTVRLKYIVLPGWNDSPEDYEGIVCLLKELGSEEMELTLENSAAKGGDRMRVRGAIYAAARLSVLLEKNGIRAVLMPIYWKKEYIPVFQRLCREIRALY